MKSSFLLIFMCLFSFSLYSQTVDDAMRRMNNGQYDIAKVYWDALNDSTDKYSKKIAICIACIKLQQEAKQLMETERYSKAIEKYKSILSKNPSDNNAIAQIEDCKRLRENYLANHVKVYTNDSYGYSLKYPLFLTKKASSKDEFVVFFSSDYSIKVSLKVSIEFHEASNHKILNEVIAVYKEAEADIRYNKIYDDWLVIRGYLADRKAFYNKSIISYRKSQYNDSVKIIVSATVMNLENYDNKGFKTFEIISQSLKVNSTGCFVNIQETDEDRWQRALKLNTFSAYQNYLLYAPVRSLYRDEAEARMSLCMARSDYAEERYLLAKKNFEAGEKYMTTSDKEMYANSYYNICLNTNCSIEDLIKFTQKFPKYPKMRVIKGCFVKAYCRDGLYSEAKDYVRNNYGIWYDENTPLTNRRWFKFIRQSKKEKKKSSSNVS